MTILQLEKKLIKLNVSQREFSLKGDLMFDAINLIRNYDKWEVFYLDEKGNRNDQLKFDDESSACEHIYSLFKESKRISRIFKLNL
ncbi:MAG: hypothetical protein IPO37_05955 [Saprospiraceae bacterium]|jgi:hypothetical protein|nr:hypothetical protein [Saprospiraceae bacterium]